MREITGDKIVKAVKIEDKKTGKVLDLPVDGVFVAIGYVPNNELATQLGLELDEQGYIKTDLMTMRTSMPGVYAAGDITGAPKQIVVAVAHGSIAAMTAFEDITSATWVKRVATGDRKGGVTSGRREAVRSGRGENYSLLLTLRVSSDCAARTSPSAFPSPPAGFRNTAPHSRPPMKQRTFRTRSCDTY